MTTQRDSHGRNPHSPEEEHDPASQTGEDKGRIKRPQRTDATAPEPDMPRGSESEHQGGPRTRH